jgi:hypothetical protein
MKRTGLTTRFVLATLALGTLLWTAPATVSAQSRPVDIQSNQPPQNTDNPTPQQLAAFGQFLDNHPEIAEQLQKNPALINDKKFVEDHPALKDFMLGHPELRAEFEQNPTGFMRDEDRYQHSQNGWQNGQGQRVRYEELFNMDVFLNGHPEIADQLKKNPSLLDNQQFIAAHPALQQFLSEHAHLRQAADINPQRLLQAVARFEATDPITRRELINMDYFLDSHPEIAERLQKDPSLIDNQRFVQDHPALQQFLADHWDVKQAFERNPIEFMGDEDHFTPHEGYASPGNENRGELASFHQFLEEHSSIASELEKKPTLANNSGYLQDHTELQAYLSANPQVSQELQANPQSFISASESANATAQSGTKTTPKPMTADPLKKQ